RQSAPATYPPDQGTRADSPRRGSRAPHGLPPPAARRGRLHASSLRVSARTILPPDQEQVPSIWRPCYDAHRRHNRPQRFSSRRGAAITSAAISTAASVITSGDGSTGRHLWGSAFSGA